jgi:hypothetical protein
MTACGNPFQNSASLTSTAAAHNTSLATLTKEKAQSDPHVTPDGKHQMDDGEPITQAGYITQRAEIVALRQPSEAAALQFWMQDDAAFGWGHRDAILNCGITEAGAAHLAGGPWGQYWTVDMGTP